MMMNRPTHLDAQLDGGLRKLIYISGPMTGYDKYNFPAFDDISNQLYEMGFAVCNPADISRENGIEPESYPDDWNYNECPPNTTHEEMMDRDLRCLDVCDAICMFGSWSDSKGANIEFNYAKEKGKELFQWWNES